VQALSISRNGVDGRQSRGTTAVLPNVAAGELLALAMVGAGGVLLLGTALTVVLAPGKARVPSKPAAPIDETEHARAIQALRPPKRERLVTAIVA
jgi:hypothetical protein